jgi:hypothetical protein
MHERLFSNGELQTIPSTPQHTYLTQIPTAQKQTRKPS